MLYATPVTNSLDYKWSGPALVTELESSSMILVKNLVDNQVTRMHSSRLFPYFANSLSDSELKSFAVLTKLLCENVIQHQIEDRNILFFCKWLGIPLQDIRNPDSWLTWAEGRFCPLVHAYCKDHNLHPRLHV